jgi:hypothetical protein
MPLHLPVMTHQLARRIQRLMEDEQLDAMLHLQQQMGNPFAVQIERFGNVTAYLAATAVEAGWWNRVNGMQEEDIVHLDDILAFYRMHQQRFYIDMEPSTLTEAISRALIARNLYPIVNGTVLYGLPRIEETPLPQGVTIRESEPDEISFFIQLWADGFEFPANDNRNTIMAIRSGIFSAPSNRRYIAYVDDTPAAMAGLYFREGLSLLSGGATLPAFRKRGCHTALTQRRLSDAAKAGCELAIGHTGTFASISQNNMERAGLRIAYQMISWVGQM